MFKVSGLAKFSANINNFISTSLEASRVAKRTLPVVTQVASITRKQFLDPSIKKPAPWPYKQKKFGYVQASIGFDRTLSRFDENTQVIVVEGNIGIGKSKFAKQLADELGMLHFPEPQVDSLYIDEYGFDYRSLDPLMPPSFKSCDLKEFYRNPRGLNVASFQMNMFILRLEQYMEALAHVLNTGQGVVLERCAFSDFVFVQALHKLGYFSTPLKNYFSESRLNGIHDFDLKPTLVIYLDADVDILFDRIKKRNIDYEVKSELMTKEYLAALDHFYKQDYLKYISKYSELLIYDWNNFGDAEAVIDDVENLKFEKYDKYDFKLKEWRNDASKDWDFHRMFYGNKRLEVFNDAQIPPLGVPEFIAPTQEIKQMEEVLANMANKKYEKGFNPYFGDKGLLFNMKTFNYWDVQKYTILNR